MKQFKGTVRYYEAVRELDNFENVAAIEVGIGEQLSYFAKNVCKESFWKIVHQYDTGRHWGKG